MHCGAQGLLKLVVTVNVKREVNRCRDRLPGLGHKFCYAGFERPGYQKQVVSISAPAVLRSRQCSTAIPNGNNIPLRV